MNPRFALRGRLAIAVLLAGTAPALAEAPIAPLPQYTLSLDPHLSLATGADMTQSIAALYSELDARVLRFGRARRSVGIPLRLLKAVVLDHPLATWLVVLDHEVFGHGGRAREFGSGAGFHLGSPWQGRSSYTSFDSRGLSSSELLRVFSGGSEANGWSATDLEREIVGGRPLRMFELLHLVRSRLVVSQYVLRTTPDPQREPLRFFQEWSGGGDVARYLGYRNEIFFGRPGITASGIEASVIDGYRQMERQARWNALDPAVWIGLWSVGQRIVRGDERSEVPLPAIHGRRFLPVPTADWLPAGGVISLETIVGPRPGADGPRWFSFTVRRGSGPGGSFGALGAATECLWQTPRLRIGGEFELWTRPGRSPGGGYRVRALATQGRLAGFFLDLGAKTEAHWPGRPADSGVFLAAGLQVPSKKPSP